MKDPARSLGQKITVLLEQIYPDLDAAVLSSMVIDAFWPEGATRRKRARMRGNALWSQNDALLITYGNSIIDGVHKPLDLLSDFLARYMDGTLNAVHILPFFPYTSDDGFAVSDFRSVNPQLGDWADINRIADKFTLMSDLVLNHVSSQGTWFNAYLQGQTPYDKFFFEASPDDDLREIVRPPCCARSRQVTAPAMYGAPLVTTRLISISVTPKCYWNSCALSACMWTTA